MKTENFSLGLALSGGAALGLAHIGVLQALDDNDIKPDCITGTSAGAFAGALYAFRVPFDTVREHAKELRWFNLSKFTLSKFGLVTPEGITKLTRKLIGDRKLEDADIPIAVLATDIVTGEKVVIREGDVAEAVTASCCIPGVFIPVTWNNRMVVDGGLVENIPISPLRAMGAKYIVAVNLHAQMKLEEPSDIIGVLVNSIAIAVEANRSIGIKDVDVMIEPQLAAYRGTDLKKEKDLYEEGYRAAESKLNEIRSLIREKASGKER